MVKAIIFDLNGILIQSPLLSERIENDFGVSVKEFLPVLKKIMPKVHMPGAGKMYDYWKPYLKKWNIGLTEAEFENYWFSAEKENKEITKFANTLKEKRIKLFVLSNNFKERASYYKKNFSFMSESFEKLYYSWQTGIRKPDEKAWKLILKENNLKAEECLYFDDQDKNVEVAKAVGLKAYKYTNNKDLIKIVLEVIDK